MATLNTPTSATGWSPDVQAFMPSETIPDALIFKAATVVTERLDGDAPVARVPWIDDADAEFVAEAADTDPAEPTLAETVVPTGKIRQLIPISREQWHQPGTADELARSAQRAIVKRANEAFIAQPKPTAPAITPPEGIVTQAGAKIDTPITDNLDPLAAAFEIIESAGGVPRIILASPGAWAYLRTMRVSSSSAATLLGAGTEDTEPRLFGVPVVRTPAIKSPQLIIIDPTAIAAAVGPVEVAQSEHALFASDSIALAARWRIGWGVKHKMRIATVPVGTESP